MNVKIYSVYDVKTAIYNVPMFAHNAGHVIRVFTDQCDNPDSPYHAHPEDYQLFEVGGWDDHSGEIKTMAKPHLVITATEIANREL